MRTRTWLTDWDDIGPIYRMALCAAVLALCLPALGDDLRPNTIIVDDADPVDAACTISDDADPTASPMCRDVNKVYGLAKRFGWSHFSLIRLDGYLAFVNPINPLRACDDEDDCAQSGPAFCSDNKAGDYVDGSANVNVSYDPSDGTTVSLCSVECNRDGTVRTGYQGCIGYPEDDPQPEPEPDEPDV